MLAAGIVGVLVVAGGVTWAVTAWAGRCGASVSEVSADDAGFAFTPAADLSTGGPNAEFLDAASELGAPFGELVAGVLDPDDQLVVLPGGDDRVIVASGSGVPGTAYGSVLAGATLPESDPDWALGSSGTGTGGGMVGDVFVSLTIPRDKAPEVRAYDPATGAQRGCAKLGPDQETGWDPPLATDSIEGGDVLVAYPGESRGLALARVTPESGTVQWTVQLPDRTRGAADIDIVGDDVAVISAFTITNAWEAAVNVGGTMDSPEDTTVNAYSTTDGKALWSYPAEQTTPGVVAQVVGVDDENDIVILETVHAADDTAAEAVHEFVAIDAAGNEVWRSEHPGKFWAAAVWGSTLVFTGADSYEQLHGVSTTDGSERWVLPQRLTADGGTGQFDVDSADRLDNRWVVPDSVGLVVLDPATGEAATLDLPEGFRGLTSTENYLILESRAGTLIYNRAPTP